MFRVYFYWLNRNSPTHKDFQSYGAAKAAIEAKFQNKHCALAKLENLETYQSESFANNI